MEENFKHELKDEEEDFEVEEVQIDVDKGKKEQEIARKKKSAFNLNQSRDQTDASSDWGTFRIRPTESLEITENESFYRTPLANILENENEYYFLVELPGLDKRHVNITLQEGMLEILGDKALKQKEEKDEKKKKEKKEDKDKKDEKKDKHKEKKDKKKKEKDINGDFLRREFRSASYYRSFHLPEEIITEEIDASFKNGILRLRVPKKLVRDADKRRIEIK